MKKRFFALFPLILTACGSNPASYLPSGTTPIVNVEADIAPKLHIETRPDQFSLENRLDSPLNVVYKLFWYDLNGVTQPSASDWQHLWLEPQQKRTQSLVKPTEESANYRLYLRGSR